MVKGSARCSKDCQIYPRINASRELKPVIMKMREVTYNSRFLRSMVSRARSNSIKYRLKVAKSKLRRAGNGLINMGTLTIPKGTVICIYPGNITVFSNLKGKKLDRLNRSDYLINNGSLTHQGNTCKFVIEGMPSGQPWNANNCNHLCKDYNCKFMLCRVQNGLSFQVVQTFRSIKPGQECFLNYGEGYYQPIEEIVLQPGCKIHKCGCLKCPCPMGRLKVV